MFSTFLKRVVLDLSELDLTNPVRTEAQIKQANIITISVESIEASNGTYSVKCYVETDKKSVRIEIYLPKSVIATLYIGDQITVQGKMEPYIFDNCVMIYVGSDANFPPFAAKAKLLSINGEEVR